MSLSKFLLIALLLSMSAGCTMIPGSHLTVPEPRSVRQQSEGDLSARVNVYPISPSLVATIASESVRKPVIDTGLENQIDDYDYVVSPGDTLRITIWDHPELSTLGGSAEGGAGHPVHSDGTIVYPFVGDVQVAGLTVRQVRERLAQALSEYIQAPTIDVTVSDFRSRRVYVTGAVGSPGKLYLTSEPMTLLEAVSAAGGLEDNADWTDVTLTRNGKSIRYSLRELYEYGNTSQNVLLRNNDIVHVARDDAAKVFVLGEVGSPKAVSFGRSDLTLADALTQAGGFSQATADASGIFVVRRAPAGSEKIADVFQLNARNAMALVLADQFPLKKRDIVYVTAAPVARWNRIIAQLLPTAQAVYFLNEFNDQVIENN
ncbi:polysaccharide export protein [uncultured Marinobacter sp.]|uniref:polysaccharide export protein n=1 Tax=uncultured Marinobacter sp. TaxID=187379 RepID=UPI0025846D8A|nr:polysaccharide export protein [uncultured Marinobacter sp.]